ncbi:MAG TPA: 50S ribosomal L9 C-terminal domain-containing protein, partial [Tepidisphaeraceae bacterium]|nr:50S ribosomal L9 C-terminal domain-containing protein [Tepidisphaeraceae bacterium]
ERERREQQERMIQQLSGIEVHLERRANEHGHLFGSVTATDIARGLQAQNFNINPEDINLPGRLDRIDTYTVQVKFAEDLATDVKIWVNADPESKAAIEAARKAQETAATETA